jgi:hypothetical protein
VDAQAPLFITLLIDADRPITVPMREFASIVSRFQNAYPQSCDPRASALPDVAAAQPGRASPAGIVTGRALARAHRSGFAARRDRERKSTSGLGRTEGQHIRTAPNDG